VEILLRAFKPSACTTPFKSSTMERRQFATSQLRAAFRTGANFPCLRAFFSTLKCRAPPGFDVLRWARSKAQLRDLVIIVLTTSELVADIKLAYELGTNSFPHQAIYDCGAE